MDDAFLTRIWTFAEIITRERPTDWAGIHALAQAYQTDVETRMTSANIARAGAEVTKRDTSTLHGRDEELLVAKALKLGSDFYKRVGVPFDFSHLSVVVEGVYRSLSIGELLQQFVTGARNNMDVDRLQYQPVTNDMRHIRGQLDPQKFSPFEIQTAGDVIVDELKRLVDNVPVLINTEILALFSIGARISPASYHRAPSMFN